MNHGHMHWGLSCFVWSVILHALFLPYQKSSWTGSIFSFDTDCIGYTILTWKQIKFVLDWTFARREKSLSLASIWIPEHPGCSTALQQGRCPEGMVLGRRWDVRSSLLQDLRFSYYILCDSTQCTGKYELLLRLQKSAMPLPWPGEAVDTV